MAGEPLNHESLEQVLKLLRAHGVEFFSGHGMHIRFHRAPTPAPTPEAPRYVPALPDKPLDATQPEPDEPPNPYGEDPDLFLSSGG